jgi:hypothetical protein
MNDSTVPSMNRNRTVFAKYRNIFHTPVLSTLVDRNPSYHHCYCYCYLDLHHLRYEAVLPGVVGFDLKADELDLVPSGVEIELSLNTHVD